MMNGGTGASTLSTGALDFGSEATRLQVSLPAPSPAARAVLDALLLHRLPDGGARLLTMQGTVRPARGHDAALLDVLPLTAADAGRIGVVRCHRPGWDADALASAWGDSFFPIDVEMLRHSDEHILPHADFAARHDDATRLGWLGARLRSALATTRERLGAIALPPSLGVETARARELTTLAGLPCGEAMAAPGGPSGLRFERSRARALADAGVVVIHARARAIKAAETRWVAECEDGRPIDGDAIVLAMGGLLGGGIEYAPSEAIFATALPPLARAPFRLTIDAPVTLGAWDRPLDVPSSLFGVPPESIAWPFVPDPFFDRVGILTGADGRAAAGLFVGGELMADAPHALLAAVESGTVAGMAAARAPFSPEVAVPEARGAAFPSRP
jgi:glycerol-3-phosphate dehydrogenase subunit B